MIGRASPFIFTRRGIVLFTVNVLLFLCSPAWPQAQPRDGDLDRTFGRGGKIATPFLMISSFSSVALQRDGKIVAVGSAASARRNVSNIAIVRYLGDGSLDPTFGDAGIVTSSLEIRASIVPPVAIQPDGKIVVAGAPDTTTFREPWAVLRYNTDGTPDTSFGAGGKVTTSFERLDARPAAIVIQPDGRILVGGAGYLPFGIQKELQFLVSRYESDGSLDKGFGDSGLIISQFFSPLTDGLTGMALQQDGKIVATGSTTGFPNTYDWMVVRYNRDGSLDASFGDNGKVITDLGRLETSRAIAVAPNGKIVVAGTTGDLGSEGTHLDIAVARYNIDGVVDKSFGDDGRVITDLGKNEDVSGLAVRLDGKIHVAGSITEGSGRSPGNSDFLVVRYNDDGRRDIQFGSEGILTTDFGKQDKATALTLQPDGKIVVAGFSGEIVAGGLDQGDFAIARYIGGPIIVVDPPELFQDFALSFNGAVRASRASKVRLTIDVVRISGFAGSVTVTPPDASDLKIFPKQDSVSTTGTSVEFILKIKKSAPRGEHQLIFNGRDALGRLRSVPVTVAVQ